LARGKWAALEALVGTEKRIPLIVQNLENHFGRRLEAMDERLRAGDAIIASTATENALTLCINNVRHYRPIRELKGFPLHR
jgi:predicted nucleic acid-binding protein